VAWGGSGGVVLLVAEHGGGEAVEEAGGEEGDEGVEANDSLCYISKIIIYSLRMLSV
jgi:hypothetical protein